MFQEQGIPGMFEQDPLFRFLFRRKEDENRRVQQLFEQLNMKPRSMRTPEGREGFEPNDRGVHYPEQGTIFDDKGMIHRGRKNKRYVF